MKAFEERQKKGDHYNKLKANFFEKMIKDIDRKKINWENKEINQEMRQRYKDEFHDKVN